MPGYAEKRSQHVVASAGPGGHERLEQASPSISVRSEIRCRGIDRSIQDDRGTIVERVGERDRGVHPLEAELRERKLLEAGRRYRHRMHARTDVVDKSGERQLGRDRKS